VTHNYRLADVPTSLRADGSGRALPVTLAIPDALTGATARRLMFTLQVEGYDFYTWNPGDAVSVNGTRFPIPQPTSNAEPRLAAEELVSAIAPYSMQIELPDGVLKQGDNTIAFSAESGSFRNIHVELDFPIGAAPPYTSPAELAGNHQEHGHPMVAIGPNAVITHVGATEVETYLDGLDRPDTFNPVVSGMVDIQIDVRNEIAMHGSGANLGIAQVELLVDGRIVAIERTDAQAPAPSVLHTFSLDTRLLADGEHEIYVRAYNPRCDASIADYQGAGAAAGQYFPLHITTDNGITAPAAQPEEPHVDVLCQSPNTPALANRQP
jgi:hypothetical protein